MKGDTAMLEMQFSDGTWARSAFNYIGQVPDEWRKQVNYRDENWIYLKGGDRAQLRRTASPSLEMQLSDGTWAPSTCQRIEEVSDEARKFTKYRDEN